LASPRRKTINFLTENNEETSTIQIFTDGSKSEHWVGAGIVIFRSGNHIKSLKYRVKEDSPLTKPSNWQY